MGVLLALTGALAFSFMNVFIRNGVRPGDTDNGVLTTMVVNTVLFGGALLVMAASDNIGALSLEAVGWFVLAGLAATFFGRQTLFGSIRLIGAARGAAIKNMTPLVTVAIALVFLGERLELLAAAGVVLIFIGVFALIAESVTGAHRLAAGTAADDPVEAAVESEALAEVGLWDRTRMMADRTVARVSGGSQRRVLLGVGLGAAAALSFGTGHAFRKVGMDLAPNAVLGAAVGSTTALISYVAVGIVRRDIGTSLANTFTTVRPWFWAAGLAGTVGQLSFFAALAFAPVSHVSVVAGSETVLTVILAALLAGRLEAITWRVVLPAILVFAGAAMIAAAR